MDEGQLERLFGMAKDYYKGFIDLSDEELRVALATLCRNIGLELADIRDKTDPLKMHHAIKNLPKALGYLG